MYFFVSLLSKFLFMILKSEVFPAGHINKPRGTKGELVFSANSDLLCNEDVEYLIFEIEGILVPFFIDEIKAGNGNQGTIKFDEIDDENKAKMFSGLTFFLPEKFLGEAKTTGEVELNYFIGFTLFDEKAGKSGCIIDIDQSTENELFIVQNGKNEILIPVTMDFITDIDHKKKIIYTDLPEGLLEL